MGAGISGLSYVVYGFSVQSIGVTKSGMALNFIPISTFLLSVWVFGEEVTSLKVLAIALVILSLLFLKFFSKANLSSSSSLVLFESS